MIRKLFIPWGPLAVLLCLSTVCSRASAEIVEYSAGHADIGVAYEDGALELHWHFGGNAVLDGVVSGSDLELGPGGAYARLSDATRTDFASVPLNLGFTGLTPGAEGSIWTLPSSNIAGLPFLGLATEELTRSDWDGDIEWTLASVSRPAGAEFSLWQTDSFGNPIPRFTTADGIDGSDSFSTSVGGHDHFNYGFTEEGVYDITLTVSGTHATDGFKTDSGTFKFVVGSATAVPEPGTVMLLALGSLGLVVGGLHQRRRRGTSTRPTA